MAARAMSGDERKPFARAYAPLIENYGDRADEVRRPRCGPQSPEGLPFETRCCFVVERRVLVELTRCDEESHHPRYKLVCTARITSHVDHHALCAGAYEGRDGLLHHSIRQELLQRGNLLANLHIT